MWPGNTDILFSGCYTGVGWDIKNLSCQVREILSLYRPTISFHEKHQALGASLGEVLGALKWEFKMVILG